jgi:hypothetical protein
MLIPIALATLAAGGPAGREPAEPGTAAPTLDVPATEELLNELAKVLAERLNRLLDILDTSPPAPRS